MIAGDLSYANKTSGLSFTWRTRLRRGLVRLAQAGVGLFYPQPRGKRLKNGSILKIDPKNRWIDFNLAMRGHYEQGTLLLIERLLPEKGVFVDVGANIGVMSVHAAICVGKDGMVYAFEPDSVNFERLSWAREANGLPQIAPLPFALGSRCETATLRRAPDGDGGLSSLAHIDGFEDHGSVLVVRLDDFLSGMPITDIDLVKIDVEGFEKNVIEGAIKVLKLYKPAVIMEMVNDEAVTAGQLLIDQGYVSFTAGDKGGKDIGALKKTPPRQFLHNNMLFIHAEKTDVLAKFDHDVHSGVGADNL